MTEEPTESSFLIIVGEGGRGGVARMYRMDPSLAACVQKQCHDLPNFAVDRPGYMRVDP